VINFQKETDYFMLFSDKFMKIMKNIKISKN
jgi:hypothetical protein